MQQERLRALGQMASGIAHDINNALSPASLYVETLLESGTDLSDPARSRLQTVQRAIEDVAETVGRMREFYRGREPQRTQTPVAMNLVVQQVVELTRARWRDMPQEQGVVVRTVVELSPNLSVILGSENELREALTNLVFNAVDAMPAGGTLTLRTRAAAAAAAAESGATSETVVVEVTDTGVGMDETTRRRCLEPFFTTKGERGTGLGLAMVYGTAQRHEADFEIESDLGRGTTARLTFPVPSSRLLEGEAISELPLPRSRLRILLVDDDPLVLESLRDTLEAEGHAIVPTNGGRAGIEAFRAAHEDGETFDVVVTDLGMPHVDGRQVAREIKTVSAKTPVILLTGWGRRLVAEGEVPAHVDCVLDKPPKIRELRAALALHGPSGGRTA
jgi:CheY-like chemotaxis protein